MKLVDAEWEKRNLNVSTIEITIEETDQVDDVKKTIVDLKGEYIVVKLPTSKNEFLMPLQEMGFSFMEDMVHLVSYLNEVDMNDIQRRLYNAVETALMTAEDIEQLKTEIRKGLFDTDRITIDPFFSNTQAQERYVNWIEDEYKKGTKFIKYIYKSKTIGFFALREVRTGEYNSFLGGIYPEYRKGGIGAIVKVPEVVKSLGGKMIETSVSTNNPVQIRNLISWGYVPKGITHTFIKHQ